MNDEDAARGFRLEDAPDGTKRAIAESTENMPRHAGG